MDTTMKLKASLLDEIAAINDNEELMEKAVKYLRRLRKSTTKASASEIVDTTIPRTLEELKQSLRESEADEESGRTYTCLEAHRIMDKEFSWLQK